MGGSRFERTQSGRLIRSRHCCVGLCNTYRTFYPALGLYHPLIFVEVVHVAAVVASPRWRSAQDRPFIVRRRQPW